MQETYIEVQMNIFYHNYTASAVNDGLPEVLRARSHFLPGLRERESYRVVLSSFLATIGFSEGSEEWRFSGEKKWRTSRPGTLSLFPPGTVLEIRTVPGVERNGMMLYFQKGESAGIHTLFSAGEKSIEFDDNDGKFSTLIKEISMLKSGTCFWEARIKLLQILSMMHHRCSICSRSDKTFADNVDNLLRRSLNMPLRREDIARELNISVSLLSHRYMKERGTSVMRRHLEMRLEQSKLHLLNGETIQRTAALLGFSSPFHLSRAFKEYFGVSPAKYTKLLNISSSFEQE